jgi:hypothetical protein
VSITSSTVDVVKRDHKCDAGSQTFFLINRYAQHRVRLCGERGIAVQDNVDLAESGYQAQSLLLRDLREGRLRLNKKFPFRLRSHPTIDPQALENPGDLGVAPSRFNAIFVTNVLSWLSHPTTIMIKRVLLLVLWLKKLSWLNIPFLPSPVGDSPVFLYIVNSLKNGGERGRNHTDSSPSET